MSVDKGINKDAVHIYIVCGGILFSHQKRME